MFPRLAKELISEGESKRPIFIIIGIFLITTAALEFPIAGMLAYYGLSDDVDFGDTLTLQGKVVSESGANLSDVRISIIGTDLFSVSDEDGTYIIPDAPEGIWRIEASLEGYKDEVHKVLLFRTFSETVDFSMERGSGENHVNDLWYFISLAIVMVIFSAFIIAGSLYSFKGKRFSVVFVGAVLGMFTMAPGLVMWFSPTLFIMSSAGFILSSSALLMTVANRKAFKKTVNKSPSKQKQ
jgi:hypothetical protein